MAFLGGGVVASWLVSSTPDQADQTLTAPLSTQVYKWVAAKFNAGGSPLMD